MCKCDTSKPYPYCSKGDCQYPTEDTCDYPLNQWLPIEYAPKDGTAIDLWVRSKNGKDIGRFNNARWHVRRWLCYAKTKNFNPETVGRATHFMIVSKPPDIDPKYLENLFF